MSHRVLMKWQVFLGMLAIGVAAAPVLRAQGLPREWESASITQAAQASQSLACGEAIPGPDRRVGSAIVTTSSLGTIKGGGPGETITVRGLHHAVTLPIDQVTGLPGTPMRGQLTITKSVDRSSPLLMQALVSLDSVETAVFRFFNQHNNNDYIITIEDGLVTGFVTKKVKRCDGSFAHLEEVSFTYSKITYEHLPSGVVSQDCIGGGG